MRKKMLWIIIPVVAVILVMGGWYIAFCYFSIGPAFPFLPVSDSVLDVQQGEVKAEQPLMAMAETEEEAKKIAEQYGIELVSFSDGVAVYQTDEKLADVIARGQEQGYPQLYLNLERTTMGETE